MSDRFGDWIQTFTGLRVYPLDARPEEIDIRDIAHSLSLTCRFNGHTRVGYSVAQHAVHVSRLVSPGCAKWALHHDDAEAYLSDVPRPVKRFMPEYKRIEASLLQVIGERFGLPWPMPTQVSWGDCKALATEKRDLLANPCLKWDGDLPEPDPEVIVPLTGPEAERLFLARFNELFPERAVQLS